MLGSFHDAEEAVQEALLRAWKGRETYAGAAPLRHWLFRITTHVCLNARKAKRRRALPSESQEPARSPSDLGEPTEPDLWITPAPDAALYPFGIPTPTEGVVEERESVALAFVALLQRLPPRQRAVLLLKDVVGFSSEEVAQALDFSLSAVSSALHRARAALPVPNSASTGEPAPELARFSAFWSSGLRISLTKANAQPALVFYRDGGHTRHSIQLPRFEAGQATSMCNLIGEAYLCGFELPDMLSEQFSDPRVSV
jgi:RNA polymerase sigma factor (sigma-70 family)